MENKDNSNDDVFNVLKEKGIQISFPFNNKETIETDFNDDNETSKKTEKKDDILEKIKNFDLKPREIKDLLDKYVIKQDEAKKVLSIAICDHYNNIKKSIKDKDFQDRDYVKQNVLILGPTGCGKTYLIKNIAKIIGVPFVKADATKYSETGYAGSDVEEMVRNLFKASNNNMDLAEFGIIYIDEIDKITGSKNTNGKDVSGKGVQVNLLKLMEETEVSLYSQHDIASQMEAVMGMMNKTKNKKKFINTKHILFIVSGAFSNIEDTIKRRLGKNAIGFKKQDEINTDEINLLSEIETKDFIEYGCEPEFIGRLPVRVACHKLEIQDLKDVLLQSEGSILKQYKEDFDNYDIKFTLSKEVIHKIAESSYKENTGARGIFTTLEKLFRPYKFELPSSSVKKFTIDNNTLKNADEYINKLKGGNHLQYFQEEITHYIKSLKETTKINFTLTKDACTYLYEMSKKTNKTLRTICKEQFKEITLALQLLPETKKFTIDKVLLQNTKEKMSKFIVQKIKSLKKSTN